MQVHVSQTIRAEDLRRLVDPLFSGHVAPWDEIILDLRRTTFASPFSIVVLATLLTCPDVRWRNTRLLCPTDTDCRGYMARSGFFEQIRGSVEIEGKGNMASVSTHWSAHTLLPLTCINTEKEENVEVQRLIHQVDERLEEMLGSGGQRWRRQKSSIRSTIRELCMNVFHHAEADEGWIAAQRYFNHYTGDPYIEIAIGDAGQGIRRSLAPSYPKLRSITDSAAMRRMVTERLTSSKDQRRGNGYYVLQRATRLLDGSFLLWSGTGAVRQDRGSQKLQAAEHATSWPGTQLKVTLTCQ